ncbi:MAG: efflux RND transporter periplasmic adaptor subunit [Candidatus Goldbacteria bacterium]|nr:efflux RND transporter periplasmic adaptor subunit [Candidatus Goldiibacteriota bacterium]
MKKDTAVIIIALFISAIAGCSKPDVSISGSGTVEIKEVDVAPKISARVIKKIKDAGETVKAGETVAVLENTIVQAQRQGAYSAYNTAKASYDRLKELYASASVSKQQFEAAEAQYNQARAAYITADEMLKESQVKAPWDGVIMEVHVEEGELVSPNTPVFTLGDMNTAKVTIYMPLIDMSRVKLGSAALVKIDAYKDKVFKGSVSRISQDAEFTPKNVQTKDERVKQVFGVEITVKNDEGMLKPGIPADVIINL